MNDSRPSVVMKALHARTWERQLVVVAHSVPVAHRNGTVQAVRSDDTVFGAKHAWHYVMVAVLSVDSLDYHLDRDSPYSVDPTRRICPVLVRLKRYQIWYKGTFVLTAYRKVTNRVGRYPVLILLNPGNIVQNIVKHSFQSVPSYMGRFRSSPEQGRRTH